MTSTPPPPIPQSSQCPQSPQHSSDLPVTETPGSPERPGAPERPGVPAPLDGLGALRGPEALENRTQLPPAAALPRLSSSDAEKLSSRIQQQAAMIAEATCELLLMIGEFDAREGSTCFVGLKSTAHWLAWTCSMSPGTAREHVRVARALPRMPLTVAEFRVGRLSYSKVREMTRLVDRVDEAALVELARATTASQLADTISSFRAVDGSRLCQDAVRQARWQVREDGMIEIRAVLPAEMGAELITALELALDRDRSGPPQIDPSAEGASIEGTTTDGNATDGNATGARSPGDSTSSTHRPSTSHAEELSEEEAAELAADITTAPTLEQRRADALLDLARTFLDAEPDDRSGEDRHVVIVQVSAESLSQNVPAGTPFTETGASAQLRAEEHGDTDSLRDRDRDREPDPDPGSAEVDAEAEIAAEVPTPAEIAVLGDTGPGPDDVPAGTSERCGVLGMGPLEIRTAERLACTGKVAITITDAGGEILHLGRSRRLASRAQRRALRLRDTTCSFPGCHQSRHLDAHHVVPWSEGGPTDIEGLALLCRRHHVMVHEGGLRLVPGSDLPDAISLKRRFVVVDADGRPVQARWPAMLEHLAFRRIITADAAPPSSADPERIASTTGGEGFRLAECVDVLCQNVVELAA